MLELSDELVEEYAWSLLVSELVRAIAKSDEGSRVPAIVESLRASGLAVGSGLVHRALEQGESPEDGSPPIFALEGRRRWDLRWRVEGGSLDRALRACLMSFGRPMPIEEVAHQAALAIQQGPKETLETMLRLLETRDTYYVKDRTVGLNSWLLDTSGKTEEDVILDNFFETPQDAEDVLNAFHQLRTESATEAALSCMEVFGPAIPLKMVLFARWKADPQKFDGAADFAAILASPEIYVAPDHCLFPSEAKEQFLDALAAVGGEEDYDEEDDVDPEALLEQITIGPEEVRLAIAEVMRASGSVSVETLAELVLEVSPEEPGFELVAQRLDEALRRQGEIAMCGRGRWIAPHNRPEDRFNEVPDPLLVRIVRVLSPQGDDVDAELEDEGLDGDLAERVRDPYREDVCGEDEITFEARSAPRPRSVRIAVPYHHVLAGTLKVRRVDGDFYGGTAGLAECVFHYEQGPSFRVWANFQLGLIFGMGEFYARYCPPSGAVLELIPRKASGEFVLRFDGETDEEMFVTEDRFTQLKALAEEADAKQSSIYEILCQLLMEHSAGASFERLVTETNLVRRTRRRLVASVLSYYHCFSPGPKGEDLWTFDPKKIDQGRRKTKKKFVRKARVAS